MTENMLVAAVLARASKDRPALADSARHVAKRSEGDASVDPTRDLAYFGAFVYALLDDKDLAISTLKQYLAVNPTKAASMRDDSGWWFRSISSDPRFQRVVNAP
jgi:hypothetical protein